MIWFVSMIDRALPEPGSLHSRGIIMKTFRSAFLSFSRIILILVLIWGGNSYAQSKIKAIVTDRLGNAHEVDKFVFQDRSELEYYIRATRLIKPLNQINRIVFEGNRGEEEQTISIYLRTGTTEVGSILTGGNSAPRAHDTSSGRRTAVIFTGVSELGPFLMRLNEVREVKILHPAGEVAVREKRFKAVIVDVKAKRFEILNLRYRGQPKFYFKQGRLSRSILISKIERIDFDDPHPGEENRSVIIVSHSGKVLEGTVNVSRVRLPGETSRSYYTRLNEVFTGVSKSGYFASGIQNVKQILFRLEENENKKDIITGE